MTNEQSPDNHKLEGVNTETNPFQHPEVQATLALCQQEQHLTGIDAAYDQCLEAIQEQRKIELSNERARLSQTITNPKAFSEKIYKFFMDFETKNKAELTEAIEKTQTALKLTCPLVPYVEKVATNDTNDGSRLDTESDRLSLCKIDTESGIIVPYSGSGWIGTLEHGSDTVIGLKEFFTKEQVALLARQARDLEQLGINLHL